MNREKAEKLLAALIFDDLDEASKAEILAYLQQDDELRERLADMRLAFKVTSDAVQNGPAPVLDQRRLKRLARLAQQRQGQSRIVLLRRLGAVAALLIVGASAAYMGLLPRLNRARVASPTTRTEQAGGTSFRTGLGESYGDLAQAGRPATQESFGLRPADDRLALSDESAPIQHGATSGKSLVENNRGLGRQTHSSGSGRAFYWSESGVPSDDQRVPVLGDIPAIRPLLSENGTAQNEPVQPSMPGTYGDSASFGWWGTTRPSKPGVEDGLGAYGVRGARAGGMGGMMGRMDDAKQKGGRASRGRERAGEPLALSKDLAAKRSDTVTGYGYSESATSQNTEAYFGRAQSELSTVAGPVSRPLDELNSRAEGPTSTPSGEVEKVTEGAETLPADREAETPYQMAVKAKPQPSEPATEARLLPKRSAGELIEEKAARLNRPTSGTPVAQDKTVQRLRETLLGLGRGQEADGDRTLGLTREALTDESKAMPETPAPIAAVTATAPSAELAPDMSPQPEEDGFDLPPASRFKTVPVNPWVLTARDHLSTFALDVDTASYTLCRRYIKQGFLPPAGAVRMEEFINAFDYNYPQRDKPTFSVYAQAARSPFAKPGQDLVLLKIGVKARTVGRDRQRPAHLVLVVDASASMGQADRLPLVQHGLKLMVRKLSPADRVSLVTCAREARLHLEGVSARDPERICRAIDAIQASGTTNLLAGLKLGYATARRLFVPGQVNHVVLCSDGVANVGQTEAEAVLQAVEADRKQGITITSVGVGFGTYNDALLEALANHGDGSYVFLDSMQQAQHVFVDQLCATLQGVAKDARIQVDFNAQRVRRYRLIGYENRDIEDKRFRDDTVDAGEVGSGQCSTALYEVELAGDPTEALGTVYVRYRDVDTNQMQEVTHSLDSQIIGKVTVEQQPRFFLAAAVARFAEWLRQSEHVEQADLPRITGMLDRVSRVLPLDRDVRALAELTRQAEHLPRVP